ncbi:MAG: hypothetical protein WBA74_21865 [Cyclobacteriaceae bacterium]
MSVSSEDQIKVASDYFAKSQSDIEQILKNEKPVLAQMGMEVETEAPKIMSRNAKSTTLVSSDEVTVELEWWGINIITNEKLTQDIISGTTATGAVGKMIAAAFGAAGVVTGGVASLIGAAVAAIFALKIAQIKLTDNGKGVHWPISWLQWGALLAAVPTGVAGIVAAGMVFIHPIRNK